MQGLAWIAFALFAVTVTFYGLLYVGIVVGLTASLSHWLGTPFRTRRAIGGAILTGVICAVLAGAVGSFSWGPEWYRETIARRFACIGFGVGVWVGAMAVGAWPVVRRTSGPRCRFTLVVVAFVGAILVFQQSRPRTNAELVALLEPPFPGQRGTADSWRAYAFKQLNDRGDEARSAVPHLIRLIERNYMTSPCRGEMLLLASLGSADDGSAEVLARVVREGPASVHDELTGPHLIWSLGALAALKEMGPRAIAARGTLRELVNQKPTPRSRDSRRQREAVRILVQLDPTEAMTPLIQKYVRQQIEILERPGGSLAIHVEAVQSLEELGAGSAAALPLLNAIAGDGGQSRVAREARRAARVIAKRAGLTASTTN